jgi:hypothetical protein
MPTGKVKMFNEQGDLASSDPMTVARTFSSTSQHCEKAMKSPKARPSVLKQGTMRSQGKSRQSQSI